MNVGDLVTRKDSNPITCSITKKNGWYGLIVAKYIAGTPPHECVRVWWPKSGKVYSIGTGLIEVINASR